MSLAAVAASISPTPTPAPEPARDSVGRGAAGSKFSTLLDTFAGGSTQSEAATDNAPETTSAAPQPRRLTPDSAPIVRATLNLDAALAKLARDAASGASANAAKALAAASIAASATSGALAPAASGRREQGAATTGARATGQRESDEATAPADAGAAGRPRCGGERGDARPALWRADRAPLCAGRRPKRFDRERRRAARVARDDVRRARRSEIGGRGRSERDDGRSGATRLCAISSATIRTWSSPRRKLARYLGLDGARATLAGAPICGSAASQAAANPASAPKRAAAATGAPTPAPRERSRRPGGDFGGAAAGIPAPPRTSRRDRRRQFGASQRPGRPPRASSTLGRRASDRFDHARPVARRGGRGGRRIERGGRARRPRRRRPTSAQPVKELQLELLPARARLGATDDAAHRRQALARRRRRQSVDAQGGRRRARCDRRPARAAARPSIRSSSPRSIRLRPAPPIRPRSATSGSQDNASNRANGDAPSGGDTASRRDSASDAERRQSSPRPQPVSPQLWRSRGLAPHWPSPATWKPASRRWPAPAGERYSAQYPLFRRPHRDPATTAR